jgi:hypothetical protein
MSRHYDSDTYSAPCGTQHRAVSILGYVHKGLRPHKLAQSCTPHSTACLPAPWLSTPCCRHSWSFICLVDNARELQASIAAAEAAGWTCVLDSSLDWTQYEFMSMTVSPVGDTNSDTISHLSP